MANTNKFVVKNGLETQNIDFLSTDGTNLITATMEATNTLSFSGTSGELFSVKDDLTGTVTAPGVNISTGELDLAGLRALSKNSNWLYVNGSTEFTSGVYVGSNMQINGTTRVDGSINFSGANPFTGSDVANWNTAFGWGDHSVAGYTGNQTAGIGLSGTTTLALDLGELTAGGTLIAGDYLIAENGGADHRQLISSIPLSIFNNDSGWTSTTGTVDTSGTPVANDFARFTDANTVAGRSYSEVKTDLSLGNVTNTSDANKPVSTAQQTALDLKANLASPTFTGTITAGKFTQSGSSGNDFYGASFTRSNTGTTTPDVWGANNTFVIGTTASLAAVSFSGTSGSELATFPGDVAASGGDSADWNTAFGWGDHSTAGYITGTGNTTGYAGTLLREDNRIVSPSEGTVNRLKFGFGSWDNDNTSPYADFLHLRSYNDASGGADNLVAFKKSGIGMRIWQQTFGSATAYASYEDVWDTGTVTTTNKANYDTAFGWGDHSVAGYTGNQAAGTGLTGTTTLSLDFDELGLGGTLVGTDHLIASNNGVENRQLISSIPLSIFNNDSGWTSTPAPSTTAYNATSWDANTDAASKNAIRDKIVTMDAAIALNTAKVTVDSTVIRTTGTQTMSGFKTFTSASGILYQGTAATTLTLDRPAGTNVNVKYTSTTGTTFLGQGTASGEIRVGTSADLITTGDAVWHTGTLTTTDKTNYDTAFGWGDHSVANYLGKGTDIPTGADLDTYITTGFFHQNSNANAVAGSNYPVSVAGMLTVKEDGLMVYQEYHQYNTGKIWTRGKYQSTWATWTQSWGGADFADNSTNWNTAHGWGDHSGLYQPLAAVLTNTTASFLTADENKLDNIEALADVTDASNVLTALSGATITAAVAAGTDKVLFQDTGSGNALRYDTFNDIFGIFATGVYQPIDTVLTNTTASFLVADQTKLDGIEASANVTDTTNVRSAGALMDDEVDLDIKTLALPASVTIGTYNAYLNNTTELGFKQSVNLEIGVDVQAYSAVLNATTASFLTADETKLDGIEALANVTDTANVRTAGALMDDEVDLDIKTLTLPANTSISTFGASIINDASEAAFKATVNLEIGTDVQAANANLTDLAALGAVSSTVNQFMVSTGAGAWGYETPATVRTTLGLVIGSDVQAQSANLTDLAALGAVTSTTDQFMVSTGAGTWGYETAATVRTTLGLSGIYLPIASPAYTGTPSTSSTTAFGMPVGTVAQRPSPVKGMFRFNDDDNSFEGYDGTAWGATVNTSGTPVANDFARFTDANTVAGRSYSEVKTDLSLGNVTNTSDANKPVSTAQQTALNLKANLASPTFTGTVNAATISGNLKDYGEITNAIGLTGGGTQDIDLTLGNSVTATVDTSANTFTFSNPTASDELCGFTLLLTNGGSQTVTWPASVDWPAATAPTLTAAGVDKLVFETTDGGTTWYGNLAGAAYA